MSTVNPEASEKEARILAAASALFGRFGLKKTTIDDIAREANLGKGTIYLYFKSKEDVFFEVVRRSCGSLHACMHSASQGQSTSEAKLRSAITVRLKHLSEMIERFESTLEVFRETRAQPGIEKLREELLAKEAALWKELLDDGCARGELTCSDTELASVILCSLLSGLDEDWIYRGKPLAIEQKAKAFADLILNGLRRR